MPAIESVYRKVGSKVAFTGVDVEDSVPAALSFLESYGATYQQVRDPRLELADALGYQAIPMSIFVDADGHIVDFRIGALSDQQLASLLQNHFGVKA
jgi:cytochrome c biogenesis protein CcmG/thiol:disulfide interchange protein DsbE